MSNMYRNARRINVLRRAAVVASAAALVVCTMPPALAEDRIDVPVLGQAVVGTNSGNDAADQNVPATVVVSLHGVRRVAGGTVVYFSVSVPPTARARNGGAGPFDSFSVIGVSAGGGMSPGLAGIRAVSVIDPVGGVAYGTLARTDGAGCYCGQSMAVPQLSPGGSFVAYQVVAPVPESVSTVDVFAADQYFQDVPVQDGLMTPAVKGDYLPRLGQGWPLVEDVADFPAASATPRVDSRHFLVHSVVQDANRTVTSNSGASPSVDLNTDVLFDFDKATVKPAGVQAIQRAAQLIRKTGVTGQVSVVGYTDNVGDDAYNVGLSKRRAQAVVAILQPLLGAGTTLVPSGRGEQDPVAPNDTAENRALNRRVSIVLPAGTAVGTP